MSTHQQFGEFLRQRRARLTPADVGLPTTTRRRTPGLRREEVAELSKISADWYVRLEQGRESLPSKSTVDSLAMALRLNPVERQHLLRLATRHSERVFRRETVPDHLKEFIHDLGTPAYIIGARFDLLCWNSAAVALFRDFSKIPLGERNTLYQMFTSAKVRKTYPNWEEDARAMLERFRATYDVWAHSPEFNELVETIGAVSPEFRKWWKAHGIRARASGKKLMRHRRFGRIKLQHLTFQASDNPDLTLVLYRRLRHQAE